MTFAPRSILFSTPVAIMGGAERALLDLVRSLRRSSPGVAVEVVVGAPGPLVGLLEAAGARTSLVPLPRSLLAVGELWTARAPASLMVAPDALSYLRRIRALIRDRRPDVVHTNGMKAHVLTTLAAIRLAPVVWHVRDFVSSRSLARRALRALAPLARGAIAVSDAVAADLRAHVGRLPVHVVHDAVDLDSFTPLPPEPGGWLDRLAGVSPPRETVVRVGLVATYARWKGHRSFLEAAALVDAAVPVQFYVVGGALYATPGSQLTGDELREWARSLGLERRVSFVGFQADAAAVYRDLDVVVHASTAPEPFGLTIAEALACGRAVIATRTAGCLELLRPAEDLLVVRPGDPVELAAAIVRLVGDEALRRRLAANAAATARRALDASRLGPAVLEVHRRCCAPGP